jgi:UDP-N-acetylglucosamine--N-acetylmuramyl-(pentapeptide) pyrophosphoryl-undecaprenol N-acetylglucosamine transferase
MPALAIAAALREIRPDVEPVLVGASRGVEARILPERSFRHHLLPFEPIYRGEWWKNVRWLSLLPRLLSAGSRVLDAEAPAVAVGTGGYASGPILLQASRRGIPIVLQEQNAFPGVTTRWLARRARHIYLGFPEARDRLHPGRATEVFDFGNPIVPPPRERASVSQARARFGLPSHGPAVLVMGGSQGARSVNRAVAASLDAGLLQGLAILWSAGPGQWTEYRAYDHPPQCVVRPFIDPISEAYEAVDLAITRAGAMTTAELCAWSLPSVLIPLPTAAGDHQTRNAEAMARDGAAIHLPESTLNPDRLSRELQGVLRSPGQLARMAVAAQVRGHPNAAQNIAREILGLVG